MYNPAPFQIEDPTAIADLVRSHPLGMLISNAANHMQVSPVPFLFDPEQGEHGTLRCHLSRANSQLADLDRSDEVLVLFQGETAYVSPSLYASKKIHAKVVPTWNYCVLEARGVAHLHMDPQWLRTQIGDLTTQMEQGRERPWDISDAPSAFTEAQVRGIVGVSISLTSLTAKFKLSQNRPEIDREGLVQGMAETDPEMARLMAAHFPPGTKS